MNASFRRYIEIPKNIPDLHELSYLEAPLTIQGNVRPNCLLQVGGFTGIYGKASNINSCKIGRFCSIADKVTIGPSEHPTDWLSTSMMQYQTNLHGWKNMFLECGIPYHEPIDRYRPRIPPVEIGNDVWIGAHVFIKAGVKIGDGAIISAGSVVIKDVPAYSIVGGVPAKVIKYRFNSEIIKRLVDIQWWKYNVFSIENFHFSNVVECIETIELLLEKDQLKLLKLEKIPFKDL
ncbi:CatB-related O-acetyltransferase [Vibrio sp. H11]|uniref:CatB-related O-acetyltransferase n=1 Tax=Vibrio sp. H11 TaxID=2565928 RepID=UPI0010A64AA8|nr:CatB-related O-acetyltransferase [Vibrio sp. H11]